MSETNNNDQNVKINNVQNPLQTLGGNILIMTNPKDEIFRIELTMRNMFLDNKGNYQNVGGSYKPLLNEMGIRRILGLLDSLISRNSILSDVNRAEIGRIMISTSKVIILELMQGKRYEIVNLTARNTILKQSQNLMYMTLMRARDGGEKRWLKGSQQELTYRTEQSNPKKGFFDRLKGG